MAATLQLTAYEVADSVNIQENTSRLYVCLQITTTAGTYNHTGDTIGSIDINGQSYSLNGKYVDYNTTTVLYEQTHTVVHTSDGSKSVTVMAVFDPNTGGTTQMQISETAVLAHIPRASTIAATDADIGAVSMVAVNRRSEAYTHSIFCRMGEISGWLAEDGTLQQAQEKISQTAIGFAVPESFYGQIPDSPTGVCNLTCTTYDQDLPVGEPQTAEFTVTANAQICAPELELTITDNNPVTVALTGDPGVMVLHASTALCELSATAKNGASIVKKVIAGREVEGDALLIPEFAAESVSALIVDSRGYSTSVLRQIEPVPYIPLTANVTAGRTDPTSGKALVSVKGNYYDGSFGQQSNALSIICRVGDWEAEMAPAIDETGYQAQIMLEGLNYLQSHTVHVIVSDQLTTLTRTVVVGKGVPVFDWGEADFRFNVPVSVPLATEDDHAVSRAYMEENTIGKSGGTADGAIYMGNGSGVQTDALYPEFVFQNPQGQTRASIMTCQDNALCFRQYRTPDHPGGEEYYLPTPENVQQDVQYQILTEKTPVTVAQGGTGGDTADAARRNLGIGCTQLLNAAGSAEGYGDYKMYLVIGSPAQNASIMTLLIPAQEIKETAVRYQIADNTDYISFNVSCSGSTLTLTKVAGNGNIIGLYGIN